MSCTGDDWPGAQVLCAERRVSFQDKTPDTAGRDTVTLTD